MLDELLRHFNRFSILLKRFFCVGIALSSRVASNQVFSALMSLTAVFGMGTGGPSSLKTPTSQCCSHLRFSDCYYRLTSRKSQGFFETFLKKFYRRYKKNIFKAASVPFELSAAFSCYFFGSETFFSLPAR